jgi:hypothetical protein
MQLFFKKMLLKLLLLITSIGNLLFYNINYTRHCEEFLRRGSLFKRIDCFTFSKLQRKIQPHRRGATEVICLKVTDCHSFYQNFAMTDYSKGNRIII